MAESGRQAPLELLDWWVEQGGEPDDARGFADWLWLNASLTGRQLPHRFVPAGGLPAATPPERVEPDFVDTTALDARPLPSRPPAPAPPDPHAPSVFPPEPVPAAEPHEAAARLLSPSLLPTDADVREQLRRRTGAVPLLLSQMPLLRRPLPLLLALRPLLRKQPHPRWRRLDEERSAERSAHLGRPWPVFVPREVPAVEVRLWLDAGVAMAVWWPLARELRQLLASSQALARVELRRLTLEPPPGAASPFHRDRQGSSGPTLHLVLSDTAGRHWWDGAMARWLEELAREHPVAILHTLPTSYQPRTALRRGVPVTLSNGTALGPNSGYAAVPLASLDPPRRREASPSPPPVGLKLPVVSLDPRELAPWAALVMGDRLARCGGSVLPPGDPSPPPRPETESPALPAQPEPAHPEPAQPEPARPSAASSPAEAADLWLAFCQQASPEAQRLMRLLAAAPLLTLPVMRLLLASELPDQLAPLPLAEVLVSGLLRRCDGDEELNPDRVQVELLPAVRELLEARLEPRHRVRVIQAITALLERHWNQQGRRDSFQTLLTDPRVPLPEDAAGLAHIANVTAAMLDRLPGRPFHELARELRLGTGALPPPLWPPAVAFVEEVFDTVRLVEAPPLQPMLIVAARLEELTLEPLRFRTASLSASSAGGRPADGEPARDPEISFREGTAWCFQQPLGDGGEGSAHPPPRLTLVEIPEGTLHLGSPPGEPQRAENEGPQHEVTLRSFFISQTPITQGQWREVAGWRERPGERWGRELDPEPAFFQPPPNAKARSYGDEAFAFLPGEATSDQRPVETVSWLEAREFCNRLSQRTGRFYTLPSEAQWEYACRAGTSTPFHFGPTISPALANYNGSYCYVDGPKGEHRKQTTPVGMFPANAWGLQDMHGNVWEWCLDHWHETYEGVPRDGRAWLNLSRRNKPASPKGGANNSADLAGMEDMEDMEDMERRLLRGGSWNSIPTSCRSAYRLHSQPDKALNHVGFRVVCHHRCPSLNP